MLRQVTLMDINSGLVRTVICSHVHGTVKELVGCVLCKASAPVSHYIDVISCEALVDDGSEEFVDASLTDVPKHGYYFVSVRAQLAMPHGMPTEDFHNNDRTRSVSECIRVTLTTWRAKTLLEIVMGVGTKLLHAVGDWRINISL